MRSYRSFHSLQDDKMFYPFILDYSSLPSFWSEHSFFLTVILERSDRISLNKTTTPHYKSSDKRRSFSFSSC